MSDPTDPTENTGLRVLFMILVPLGWMLRGRRAGLAQSVRNNPAVTAPETIRVSSPAFIDGGAIPNCYASMDLGPNLSPPLRWDGAPANARQLLLIMEDTDAPTSLPEIHLIALLPGTLTALQEGQLSPDRHRPTASDDRSSAIRYIRAYHGRAGYVGPRPLPGHGPHRYGFHLYALNIELNPSDIEIAEAAPRSLDILLQLIDGHVIARGALVGVSDG